MKKIYGSIKKNKDELKNFVQKLLRHILPAFKSYNFCVNQFSIRRIIENLFQTCELRESRVYMMLAVKLLLKYFPAQKKKKKKSRFFTNDPRVSRRSAILSGGNLQKFETTTGSKVWRKRVRSIRSTSLFSLSLSLSLSLSRDWHALGFAEKVVSLVATR